MTDLEALALSALVYGFLLVGIELIQRFTKISSEYLRKLAHASVGLLGLYTAHWFHSHWYVLGSTSSFLALLILSKQKGWLRSIHGVARNSYGDYFFPVILYTTFFSYSYYGFNEIFYLPLLVMSVADPAAFLVGREFTRRKLLPGEEIPEKKTLVGMLAFFIVALISVIIVVFGIIEIPLWHAILFTIFIPLLTAPTEFFSKKGWDNFTVPILITAILVVYLEMV